VNVSLTTEMEQWVQQKVGTGLYTSTSKVVREALRLGMEWDEGLSREIKHLGRGRRRGTVE